MATNEQLPAGAPAPKPGEGKLPAPKLPPGDAPKTPPAAVPPPLTPEEQMAAFEKDLKENDWGHQPC